MIACGKIREMLMTSYVDDELDVVRRSAVDAHLKNCSGCRELLDLLKTDIAGIFENSPVTDPSSDVWDGVLEKISEREKIKIRYPAWEKIRRLVLPPVPATVAALMVTFFVFISIMNIKSQGYDDSYLEQYFGKQARFLDYLESNGRDYYPVNDHLGLKSPIEKYLF